MAFPPSKSRRGGGEKKLGEDHLIPIMNLMVILIPFLLKAAVFVTTVALQVTLPAASSGGGGSAGGEDNRVLMVSVNNENGFAIINEGAVLEYPKIIDSNGNKVFDFEGLSEKLDEIKILYYEDHNEVYLGVQPDVLYADVINTMDVVRGETNSLTIETEEQAALYNSKIGTKVNAYSLFPNIIFGAAIAL